MSMDHGDVDLYLECELWGAVWEKAGSRVLGIDEMRETNSRKKL